jgi:translation initiation factor IF-1
MARESAIEVEGAVVEILPNKMYRVELANGHRLLAYVAGRTSLSFVRLAVGDNVQVELSPYDLSSGRLILKRQTS